MMPTELKTIGGEIIYRKNWRIYFLGSRWAGPWTFSHDDYDGAIDSCDTRCGQAKTVEGCFAAIEEIIADEDEIDAE